MTKAESMNDEDDKNSESEALNLMVKQFLNVLNINLTKVF